MSDAVVTPTPKKSPGLDRLRRRLEHYRKQQQGRLLKYSGSLPSLYELQMQETLLLKQRHLDSKAKKSAKKTSSASASSAPTTNSNINANAAAATTEKRPTQEQLVVASNTPVNAAGGPPLTPASGAPPSATHLPPRYGKRSLEEDGHAEEDTPASKVQCTTASALTVSSAAGGPPPPSSSTNSQFSASEMVQKVEFASQAANGGASACAQTDGTTSCPSTLNTSTPVSNHCSHNNNNNNNNNHPTPSMHSPMKLECKTELIEASFMEDLDVDLGVEGLGGDLEDNFRNIMGEVNEDFVDDIMKQINSNSEIANLPPEFMKELEFDEKRDTDLLTPAGGMMANMAGNTMLPNSHLNPLHSSGGAGGNQFSFGTPTELSPAALTLKQMAEQHQHKNQINMGPMNMGPVPGNSLAPPPAAQPHPHPNNMPLSGGAGGMNPAMRGNTIPYGYSHHPGGGNGPTPSFNRNNSSNPMNSNNNGYGNMKAMYGSGTAPYHHGNVPITMQGGNTNPNPTNNGSNSTGNNVITTESSLRSPLIKKENMFAQSPLANIPPSAASPNDFKNRPNSHNAGPQQQMAPTGGSTGTNPSSMLNAKFSPGNTNGPVSAPGSNSNNGNNNNGVVGPGQHSPMNMQPKTPNQGNPVAYMGGANKPGTPNHMAAMGGAGFHNPGPAPETTPTPPAQCRSPMVNMMNQQQLQQQQQQQMNAPVGPTATQMQMNQQQMHMTPHGGAVGVQPTQMSAMQSQMNEMKMSQQQLPMYYSNMGNNGLNNAVGGGVGAGGGVMQQQMNNAQNSLPNPNAMNPHAVMMNNAPSQQQQQQQQQPQQAMMNTNTDSCYNFHPGQAQTINFTQQQLRGNAAPLARMPSMQHQQQQQQQQQHMLRMQMIRSQQQQQQAMLRPPPPEYKPNMVPNMVPNMATMNRGVVRPGLRPEMGFPNQGVNTPYQMNTLSQQATPMRHPNVLPQGNPNMGPNMQYQNGPHGSVGSGMVPGMNPAMMSMNRPTGYVGGVNIRGQRPPNVTVGPEGMNVMANGPRPTDWRTQQQMAPTGYPNPMRMNAGNPVQQQQQTQQQMYSNVRMNYHVQQQQSNVQSMNNGGMNPMAMNQSQQMGMGMTGNGNNAYQGYNNGNNGNRGTMGMPANPNMQRHGNGGGGAMNPDYGGFDFLDNIPTGESAQFCGDAQELLNNFDPNMGYSLLDSL